MVGKMGAVIWGVWRKRNEKLWRGVTQTPQQCLHLSLSFLKDWTEAQQKKEPGRSGGHCQKETRWKLPPLGYAKCNVDAAIFLDMKAFGVGMVLRDDSGRIIDCNMRRFQGWCQP